MKTNRLAVFDGGAIIGTLGGLIGLGGAEFRLPLLIGAFGFASLEAVILNKAMSIVVVASALPFRAGTIPFNVLMDHWEVILNLLAGSLLGDTARNRNPLPDYSDVAIVDRTLAGV